MKSTGKDKTSLLNIIYPAIIVLFTAAVYLNSCTYPVLESFDDHWYITENVKNLQLSWANLWHWLCTDHYGNYLPLTMWSYMIDYNIGGLNSLIYHLQNIFWHVLTVLGVYTGFRLVGIRGLVAFTVAVFFAVHPQRVESVVWLSERKDVLCGAFYIWSVVFYIRFYRQGVVWQIPCFVLFVLALMSKPMAVSLPLILTGYIFYRSRNWNPLYYLRKLWPYFLLSLGFAIIAWRSQHETLNETDLGMPRQALAVIHNLYWYIGKTILPVKLNPLYPRIALTTTFYAQLGCYIAAAAIISMLIYRWHRERFLYGFIPLVFCYVCSLLPVIGIFQLSQIDFSDRYSYLPSIFVWLAVASMIERILKSADKKSYERIFSPIRTRILLSVIAVFYFAFLVIANQIYTPIWRNYDKLMEYSATRIPFNPGAARSMGIRELNRGNLPKAMECANLILDCKEKHITILDKLNALGLKATVYYRTGRKTEALPYLEKAAAMLGKVRKYRGTDWAEAGLFPMMADCYLATGKPLLAARAYERTINWYRQCRPGAYEIYFYSGMRDSLIGNLNGARKNFARALVINPKAKQAENNLKRVEAVLENHRNPRQNR